MQIELPRSYLDLDGTRLAYRAAGPEGASTVLLLHGWGASLDAMAGVQQGLAGQFRVLAFDLPGFGESSPPPTAWGSLDYARTVARALDLLDIPSTHVVGHSFGGKVALHLAVESPTRVGRLVLVDSAGVPPRRSAGYHLRVAAYKCARRLVGNGPLRGLLERRVGSTDYRAAGAMRPTLVRSVSEDLRPLLPRIQTPALIVWGERDEDTPLSNGQLMERQIPNAGLVVFPGAGHFAYADDLPRFCTIVTHFLSS
jgi:pimeloyl-ACP methyl ester carboxylesterase